MAGQYDLAIIGAGFAGLAAAHAAAARGVRTIVLDRKDEAGARPHTTGLLVKEVADLWDVPRDLTRKIHGVRLYSPSLQWIDLVRPGYHFLATDTPALLRWWAKQARAAGACVRFRAPWRGARLDGGRVRLEEHDIHARYMIGADGARSRVARDLNLGANRRFLVGVEGEYQGVEGVDEDRLHVFLDSRIAPGYIAWVVPGVGRTQVGLAVQRGRPANLDALARRNPPRSRASPIGQTIRHMVCVRPVSICRKTSVQVCQLSRPRLWKKMACANERNARLPSAQSNTALGGCRS